MAKDSLFAYTLGEVVIFRQYNFGAAACVPVGVAEPWPPCNSMPSVDCTFYMEKGEFLQGLSPLEYQEDFRFKGKRPAGLWERRFQAKGTYRGERAGP